MLWVKTFHIVFIASWFAGLFYLPRIFVNLAMVAPASVAERDRVAAHGAQVAALHHTAGRARHWPGPVAVAGLGIGRGWQTAGCMPLGVVVLIVLYH